jgi:hypothetical protein
MDLRSNVRWLVAVTVVAGCGNGPAMESSPPAKVATRMDPATTTECPFGGTVVSSGLDSNGNGQLDDAEVKTRTMVCNDAPAQPPPTILVRLVPEPANGGHCAEGGTAVQSGPDRNGNGRLDDDEVTHTDFVCSLPVVTRLAVEPVGDRCAAGGVVFLAGPDRDGDGKLDDAEIESTEISCGDRVERDVIIFSPTDVTALKDVRVITGLLGVFQVSDITLPKLEQIGVRLQIGLGSGGAISLPALQSIGGELAIRDNTVTAVDCPQLHHIGSLTLFNSTLHDLSGFPALAEIAGDVSIDREPALVSAAPPPMTVAGDLHIGSNPDLATVEWTVWDQLGNVDISGNDRLETLHLSIAPQQGPRSVVGDVRIASLTSLANLQLSANRAHSVDLSGQGLRDLALGLGSVDEDLVISGTTSPFGLTLSDPDRKGHVEVSGDLRITGTLEALHSSDGLIVGGATQFTNTQLREIAPVGAIELHGALQLVNNPLLTLVAPITLGGSLVVRGNALLPTLAFPRFTVPGELLGDLVITDNPVLASAPALATVTRVHGNVTLQRNPLLPSPFGAPLAGIDGGLLVTDNAGMTELSLPSFAHVGTFIAVSQNASLTTISMPALVELAQQLGISDHPQLRSIAFDALTHTGGFSVARNPHLPTCLILALFARVDGGGVQFGNDDAATCAR